MILPWMEDVLSCLTRLAFLLLPFILIELRMRSGRPPADSPPAYNRKYIWTLIYNSVREPVHSHRQKLSLLGDLDTPATHPVLYQTPQYQISYSCHRSLDFYLSRSPSYSGSFVLVYSFSTSGDSSGSTDEFNS